ncbi:MAG TPA: hypothetical protein VKH44_02850, partial [Pirellulaceae bacterium]|nr:hypothetical protein [Pirellulaceae bacterium]
MTITDSETTTSDESDVRISPRRTRIDSPHQPDPGDPAAVDQSELPDAEAPHPLDPGTAAQAMLEVEEPTAEMVAAVAGESLDSRREQLQLQVGQLAGHLRERLREVDRREATLNARVAQLESDLRSSRLWLRERELSFQDREIELQRQIEELQERSTSRGTELETESTDIEAQAAELTEREHLLQLREDELRERRFEVDRQAAALRHSQQLWQQQHEREEQQLAAERQRIDREAVEQRQQLTNDLEQLVAQRDQQLRAAEALLNEHAQQLERDRTLHIAARQEWEEQKNRQKLAIDELRTSVEAELSDRRTRLEARQEWIERQKSGLEQVRDEALRLHRQSLEMRLLAEQLWSQITGALTPTEVTQAIAQLRLKLAEQYRIEEEQLTVRRDELIELSEKIAGQHRELAQL